tara:strand:+ start:5710 stop:8079 length:2370 start_codon:yes stop_codon:yes gene_type:complete
VNILGRQVSLSRKQKILSLLGVGVVVVWMLCLPTVLFKDPTATVVTSKEGIMLGARIADDGQWRFPEIDSVPYRFKQSILYFEDEYFYSHPGFNPISMAKATLENISDNRRRGASTLTQQVIRLSRKNQKRTYFEKVIELFQATRLEAGYSKDEILGLYASHAPFGGNVVGLQTAAWRYFGIPAEELSWGQAAALAVLPNAPALIFPGKNEEILKAKRDFLLKKLWANAIIDEQTYDLALDEALPGKPLPLPDLTPHFTEKIRRENKGEYFKSTIDFQLQQQVNTIVANHHRILSQNQINNLAVIVIDVDTRMVLAYTGNAPTTPEHQNYVDIIQSYRSTGSVLKPFLYAAMLDDGEILPDALVADTPLTVNGYSPENFDKVFNGAVPASVALARSLNVPAVRMLQHHGLERFYDKLKAIGLDGLTHPADYYGLSMILGGGESSLLEITQAYAGMASVLNFFNTSSSEYRTHEYGQCIFSESEKADLGSTVAKSKIYDAGAIYKTFEAMRQVNRPAGELNWKFFENSKPIAWKTGTSFGFKDAWAVGVTPRYAIGVWAGNADGEGRPGLSGVESAAPVLFDVLNILPGSDWFTMPYDELVEAEVCGKSGQLAGPFCEGTKMEWIPNEGVKTAVCPYHQQVFVDATESYRVNNSCYPLAQMKAKQWFTLPPAMEYYYAPLHPEYEALPPFKPGCASENEELMEFIFPKKNEAIVLPKNFDEEINAVVLRLAHRDKETKIFWYLDDAFIGATETFHELSIKPKPGEHMLTAVDQNGNEIHQKIEIALSSEN